MSERCALPAIDDFRLSNILENLENDNDGREQGAALRHVAKALLKVNQNYVNDIAFELARLFENVEFEDIIKNRMDRLKTSIQTSDRLITQQSQKLEHPKSSSLNYLFSNLSHSSLNNNGDEGFRDRDAYDPHADVLDLKELVELTLESKKRFQRITSKMKMIETNLPRRDRLFVVNSPHRHHYPRLARFGLHQDNAPADSEPAISEPGSSAEVAAPAVEQISDIKLNQYIQLEQELSELEKKTKTSPSRQTHPLGLTNLGISPIRKNSINPTSLLLGLNHMTQQSQVELNSETVLVKDLSATNDEVTSNDHYIDDLKKYITE